MEIVELLGNKEFPRVGLQIEFPDALCPFALICEDEVYPSNFTYVSSFKFFEVNKVTCLLSSMWFFLFAV